MSKLRDRQSQAIEALHKRSTEGKDRERLKRQYAELSKEIEGWDAVIQNLRSSVEED
jgi:DNA gyrase/topoisomerase IV subunit A